MILLSSLLNQLGKKEVAAPGRKSWRTSMLSAGPALGLATCNVSIRRTFSAVVEAKPNLLHHTEVPDMGVPEKFIHLSGIVHDKPSIWGTHILLRKPPSQHFPYLICLAFRRGPHPWEAHTSDDKPPNNTSEVGKSWQNLIHKVHTVAKRTSLGKPYEKMWGLSSPWKLFTSCCFLSLSLLGNCMGLWWKLHEYLMGINLPGHHDFQVPPLRKLEQGPSI